MSQVHEECLRQWIEARTGQEILQCEVCHEQYQVRATGGRTVFSKDSTACGRSNLCADLPVLARCIRVRAACEYASQIGIIIELLRSQCVLRTADSSCDGWNHRNRNIAADPQVRAPLDLPVSIDSTAAAAPQWTVKAAG